MTKVIPLTQGKVAIVDDEDYEEISKYTWSIKTPSGGSRTCYAQRLTSRRTGKRKIIKMHRQIMGFPEGKYIDHINRDGLDNRRENLRLCTNSQNMKNCLKYSTNTSGMNCVYWVGERDKWRARICKDGRRIHLGYFDDKEEAGRAVDKKAIELFGEFAVLNFQSDKF